MGIWTCDWAGRRDSVQNPRARVMEVLNCLSWSVTDNFILAVLIWVKSRFWSCLLLIMHRIYGTNLLNFVRIHSAVPSEDLDMTCDYGVICFLNCLNFRTYCIALFGLEKFCDLMSANFLNNVYKYKLPCPIIRRRKVGVRTVTVAKKGLLTDWLD